MGVRWDYINEFVEVAKAKNIRTASKTVGLDHSNVTKHLSNLEEQIGARLFERTDSGRAKRTVLTPVGKRLYTQAKQLSDFMENIIEDTGKICKKVKTLSIRTTPGLANSILLNVINKMINESYSINFNIETTYDFSNPPKDRILITGDMELGGGFSKELLITIQPTLFVSAEYARLIGMPRKLEECMIHKFLVLDNKGTGQSEHLNYLGPMIQPLIISQSLEFLIELCRQGMGILELADIHPATSSLEAIPLECALPVANIFIYCSNELLTDPETNILIKRLKEEVECIKLRRKISATGRYEDGHSHTDEDIWYEPS